MKEHHLTNKAAKRLFLPNQKGKSAKTIREWLHVYNTKGPGGFFPMNNDKQTVSYDKTSLQGKSNEELIEIINNLQMKVDVYSEIEKLLKKKESYSVSNKEKAQIINNLSVKYPKKSLCTCLDINEKTYYNNKTFQTKEDKYVSLKNEMFAIREEHKKYGCHRIFDELIKRNYHISYQTCFNLYTKLKLTLSPKKKGFKSSPAQIPPQPNLMKELKNFIPSKILCTDGVEMKVNGKVIHFAFIINPATRYILCYHYSYKEDSELYRELLNKLSLCLPDAKGFILHTDQGSCFTSKAFYEHIKNMGLILSMSAKGTPTDNPIIENFHGILKREIYNNVRYCSVDELIKTVDEYILYYNYKRCSYKEKNTPFERLFTKTKDLFSNLCFQNSQVNLT